MQGNKVYVQRLGQNLFRVPIDSFNKPVPVQSVTDMPDGCFPMTVNSEAELRAMFPQSEFVFLTAQKNNTVVTKDAEVTKQALAMLGQSTPPTKTHSVAVANDIPIASNPTSKQKCEEFLRRLQTALQYASKKHEKKLQDQIAIVEELIRDVF